jgi:hypothetical protein
MHPNDRKKVEQSIALLREVLGEKGGSQLQRVTIMGLDESIAALVGSAEKSEPEVKELTNALTTAFVLMQIMLDHSAVCRALNDAEKRTLQ